MLTLFGYRSKNAVHGLIEKLVEQGYLAKQGHKLAMTGRLTGALRLIGTVQAGFPSPAEEELLDTLSLDEFLISKPEATFLLKVTGDSMLEAGILPGDMVLVERGAEPKANDIVIAQVDGEWTMKYFSRDEQGVRLDPANPKYRPIRPARTLEVGGVVRSVIRKLG
jgi:repressor LexA